MKPISIVLATLCIGIPAFAEQVQVRLVADVETIEPGKPFRLGVLFTIPDHAHIYWRNPGSSGLATGIEWDLPEGFEVGELQWPNPERFEIKEINDVTYGYQHETLIFAEVTPPETFDAASSPIIAADPYWLICLESGQCIPEGVRLELASDRDASADIQRYAARLPRELDSEAPVRVAENDAVAGILRFETVKPWVFSVRAALATGVFFPDAGDPWDRKQNPPDPRQDLILINAGEKTEYISGVATLPLRNAETGDERTLYVRVGAH